MSTQTTTKVLGQEVAFDLSGPWTAYWLAFLRVITGYWFFHAGLSKYAADSSFSSAWWLNSAEGTAVGPITVWFAENAQWFVDFMIPFGQVMIGLGLMVGVLARLAAFFGAFIMAFFYVGNADFAHGFVNGDLFGLLLFATVIVFGSGRLLGGDALIEKTRFVQNHPRLRYLLG